jgi:tRNA dimethylallyltransferase
MKRNICVAIIGPTASGKTSLAIQIAERVNGEIICMDSTTIYKGFDIGTSKPTQEEQAKIPHHLVDILDPDAAFSAAHFVDKTEESIETINAKGKLPIVVGGTYFYLRALQYGMYPNPPVPNEIVDAVEREYFEEETLNTSKMHADLGQQDPETAKSIHPNDRYRLVRALSILKTGVKPSSLTPVPRNSGAEDRLWMKYAIALSRHQVSQAIVRRTEKMLADGLVEEARRLLEKHPQSRALQSIGYAEAVQFLQKKLTEKQLRNEIIEKTRQLAKRQVTWLRSDPEIRYVDFRDLDRIQLEIENLKFALTG